MIAAIVCRERQKETESERFKCVCVFVCVCVCIWMCESERVNDLSVCVYVYVWERKRDRVCVCLKRVQMVQKSCMWELTSTWQVSIRFQSVVRVWVDMTNECLRMAWSCSCKGEPYFLPASELFAKHGLAFWLFNHCQTNVYVQI
jgi:hypothetical protein